MILTDVQQVAQAVILAQSLGALESNTVLDAAAPFTNEQKTDFVRIAESAWTEEDYQILADGIRNGDSYTAIGNII